MGSLFSLLNVARDGLQAQSAGVSITGQNITNVNTPGYVRRGVILSSRAVPKTTGGVDVQGYSRSFNRATYQRLTDERGRLSAAQSRANALAALEGAVAPGEPSIGDRVSGFFSALSTWSGSPADTAARLDVLRGARDLATHIAGTAAALDAQQGDLATQASGVAGEINERIARIATLNTQIAEAEASGTTAADLRDQRDQLVGEVGDRIGARALEDERGQVTLYAAGVALVDGGRAASVSAGVGAGGALQVMVTPVSGAAIDVTASVTQGTLGGIREARDTDIPRTMATLDQFASDLAGAMNTAHSAGFALDGTTGRALFVTTSTVTGSARALTLNSALDGHPELLGAAARATDVPGGNDVALRMAGLGSRALGAGSAPPGDRVAALVAEVGTRRAAAEAEVRLRTDTVGQATELNESASGVSLDEEMVNLSRFQRAFEASTRVLRTADELLEQLMNSF